MTAPKKPADRKPKTVKDEAKRADLTVDYGGIEYTISGDNVDNVELFELVEEGKMLSALKGFVGADQWAKFKDSVRTPDGRVPMAPMEGFAQAIMDAVGNLSASQSS